MKSKKKIILAYSGGLDTSVILKWLQENYNAEVICYTADIGQEIDRKKIFKNAKKFGVKNIIIKDLKDTFVKEYVYPMIRGHAIYEGVYLLGTSIARPLIAKDQIRVAKKFKAYAVSHGATGKGNDQVRFELGYHYFGPKIKIIAPWRIWKLKSRTDLINYAIKNNKKSVTFVHKGNIMKYTEGAFRNWGYELAEKEFKNKTYSWDIWERTRAKKGMEVAENEMALAKKEGKILIKDAIADITLQQVLTRPKEFDVIATMNLNGDYLSDALAAQVGGIGIAPGGNINFDTGHAIFEATHGTAPKYANQDKVNPGSLLLSGEMMLRYLGWTEAADNIIKSMDKTIANRTVTYDFARLMDGAKEIKCH